MTENTKIEWCDHTFNPWIGCTAVGPGCDRCYAEAMARRWGWAKWGAGEARRRTSLATLRKPLKWNADAEKAGVRARVFCGSLMDVFDREVPREWREGLFGMIRATPWLDWILVTKRIGNAAGMLPGDWNGNGAPPRPSGTPPHLVERGTATAEREPRTPNPEPASGGGGYPNVWLVATICDQGEADRDIGKLLEIPAVVHGVSFEPALGAVDFRRWISHPCDRTSAGIPGFCMCAICGEGVHEEIHNMAASPRENYLDWIIAGGESGAGARAANPEWFRSVRDQCQAAGVAFFFKQWGEWVAEGQGKDELATFDDNGDPWPKSNWHFWLPGEWASIRVGKGAAGRVLDGRTWDEFPGPTPQPPPHFVERGGSAPLTPALRPRSKSRGAPHLLERGGTARMWWKSE